MRSATGRHCLFHLVQGEFRAPVSAVVARGFEGGSERVGSLVGEVAQDLGQEGSACAHAGDHGIDDLGPGSAHGQRRRPRGRRPRVGQKATPMGR